MDKKYNQILDEIINNHWAEKSLDALSDIVIMQDLKGKVIQVNKYAEEILGYKEEDIVGKTWIEEFIPEENQSEIKKIWEAAIRKGVKFSEHYTNPIITKSGEVLLISWSNVRIAEDGQIAAVLSIGHDVTRVYQLADELKRSEEFLKASQKVARIGSWMLDIPRNKLTWSDEVFNIFGVKKGVIFAYEDFLKLVHKDDRDLVNEAWAKAVSAKGVKTSNYEITHRLIVNGDVRWVRENATVFFDNGKPVKGIGTVEDITAKRELEDKLIESATSQRNVIDNMPVGVHLYHLDEKDNLIFEGYSKKADEILKVDHVRFVGKEITKAFPSLIGTEIPDVYKKAAKKGIPYHAEQTNYKDKQISGAFEVWAFQVSPRKMAAMFFDITERKRIQTIIEENENKYRTLFESVGDGVFVMEDNVFIDCNENAAKLFGLRREDIIGKNPSSLSPKFQPDGTSSEKVSKIKIQKTLAGSPQDFYWQHKRRDNTLFYTEVSLRKLDLGKGKLLIASVRDVTDRVNLEKEITKEKELVDKIMMTGPVGIVLTDDKGQLTYANERAEQILELSKGKIKTRKYNDPDWQALTLDESPLPFSRYPVSMVLNSKRSVKNVLHKIKMKDRRMKTLSVSATPIFNEGNKITTVVAIIDDVTHDYEREEKLRESESRFSSFMKNVPAAVFIKDSEGRVVFVNDEMNRIFGSKSWFGKTASETFPGSIGRKMDADDRRVIRAGKPISIEEIIVDRNNKERTFLTTKFPIEISRKKRLLGGMSIDITEKRALEEVTKGLAKFPDENPNPVFRVSTEGKILYSNVTGNTILSFFKLKVGVKINKFLMTLLERAIRSSETIRENIRIDDQIYVFSILKIKGESYVNFYGRNVTNQLKAEENLRVNEQKFRSYIDNSPDGIMVVDEKSFRYIEVNPAVLEMTGYSVEDFLKMRVGDLTHPDDVSIVQSGIRKGLQEGEVDITVRFVRNDKSFGWWIVSGRRIPEGKYILFAKEITEQKALEGRYRSLFEGIKGGVAVYKPTSDGKNFVFVDYNSSAEKLDKTPREKVIGRKVDEVYPGVHEMGLFKVFKRVNATGRSEVHPISMYKDDKLKAWRENYVYKLPTGEIVAIYDDLTEKKIAEEKVIESENKYRTLFENMNAAFAYHQMIYDEQGHPTDYRFIEFNESFLQMTGFRRSQIQGKTIREVVPGIVDDKTDWIGIYGKVASTGEEVLLADQYSASLGRWYSISAYSPSKGFFATVFFDVTERREIEDKLQMAMQSLEKSNRDLTRLNEFMIGRELKMKDLKLEVKRLKEKLGEE